ncbi:MAG: acyl-CoA dehydrogenase family protein [Pseudomonadales bacterium]|jgi:alkylation response protein AidB-like acyl-CoA dehydrogenase|nr:acyl-CoA dehydrogenase family protein [Pseudomonadales bacterium]MDP6472564.1 acyl-CoA dehydrogenase family protein [Pseudomonadales bacterium]MDP6829046.1 acyl-CoA dehydrogenase family protein [Pseudomonadales bacterium]MDP6971673.1 acyl-CoA dehydrogenase family protein [Pseudomonadales bacterium]
MNEMSLDDITGEVNAWLDENWDPNLSLEDWRRILVDGGWATPHWPSQFFGRDFTLEQSAVVARIFNERGVVPVAQTGPRRLAAETILAMGNDDQKSRYLRPILTGEHSWCQLFSEPGSGSDLAGLSTKAQLVDGRWIINGQKVWNTSAHHADYGILVARTDWDVPKHQGISFFLIHMHQPGVEVRPLKQMNGHASFNEVFMTDAVVAAEDLVGGEGNGWAVAKTTLSYERRLGGVGRSFGGVQGDWRGRVYQEYEKELTIANEPYTWYPQRQGRVDLVLPRARETGAIQDPATRQEIARLICMQKGASLASAAAEAKRKSGSNELVPAGSIGKLAASVIARQAAHVHTLISSADAMRSGPDSAENGLVAEVLISVPAISIAGGTDEIQRNIISERVLTMPKEMRADTGPFRDIKRNE